MNVVTTRSVNRPNARLAVHAFRANKMTKSSVARNLPHVRRVFRTHGPGNRTIVSRVSNIMINVGRNHSHRRRVIIRNRIRSGACATPCATHLGMTMGSRMMHKRRLARNSVSPGRLVGIGSMATIRRCLLHRIRGMCHVRNIRVNSGRVRMVMHRVLHGIHMVSTTRASMLPNALLSVRRFASTGRGTLLTNGVPTAKHPILLNVAGTSLRASSFLSTTSFRRAAEILASTTVGNGHSRLLNLGRGMVVNGLIPTKAKVRHCEETRPCAGRRATRGAIAMRWLCCYNTYLFADGCHVLG